MAEELSKKYLPGKIETKIYKNWEKSGYFKPRKAKEKYVAFMAPVNITGNLHIGHALENTLMDVLVRRKRMQGFETLWLPGTDHAGIATQNVVEKELKQEGLNRQDIGKDKFIERAWQWREKYGNIILNQFKKLGVSVDWSRSHFTMDKDYQEAVKVAFKHYQEKGWIYKGRRLINWCPRCGTALSDLEVEYKEKKGKLWYLKYPLKIQGEEGENTDRCKYIVVATTRPETMLGDTAVAVHPEDERYRQLIGKTIVLPLVNREIPIIADDSINKEFGTGAVKVTPAHSSTDFDIAQRNNLPSIQIINEEGKMTKQAGRDFEGISVSDARKKVLKIFEKKKLFEKEEEYIHNISVCYRCGAPIEPLISSQWFLKMETLAKLAIDAVKSKKVRIYPKKWEKSYFNWLKNIKDWCISRQIWWGHELPIENSNDVLDTWFSSALWPFASLGWPQNCKEFSHGICKNPQNDLSEFYPGDIISSAPEILYLWHVRMIFSGMEFMGRAPFKTIYIHPTVLTKEGKRMSKSLGTGIDPLDLIQEYGADATRFGLLWMTGANQAIRFNNDNIIMGQKFCNKLWNATRFILMNKFTQISADEKNKLARMNLTSDDKDILNNLRKTIKSVNDYLDKFRFDKATETLYEFFWHDFCDIYLEKAKLYLRECVGVEDKKRTQNVLFYVLLTSLKLLHPFIPFITEEIYQKLPIEDKKESLMIENWPK